MRALPIIWKRTNKPFPWQPRAAEKVPVPRRRLQRRDLGLGKTAHSRWVQPNPRCGGGIGRGSKFENLSESREDVSRHRTVHHRLRFELYLVLARRIATAAGER